MEYRKVEREVGSLRSQMEEQNKKLEQGQTAYHREASRLESLRNIAERYEGYGNSIRRVMEQKDRQPGIHGVVADLIKVEKAYETAVETALGGSIQNIVTDNEQTAKVMIEYLKKNRYGRATFLPLTKQFPESRSTERRRCDRSRRYAGNCRKYVSNSAVTASWKDTGGGYH